MTTTPILSLIVGGRNDSYMGDFLWRLGTCINFLGESLRKINALDKIELVVCDWGSEKPIHEAIELTDEGRHISRFIVVPPEIAKAAQKDSPFPIPIVQNIAIRRSRGEFIAQTDSDILFRPQALENLIQILEGKRAIGSDLKNTLGVCSRRHLPFEIALCYPGLKELERYLDRQGSMLPYEPLISGFATPSGLALLHKSAWEECRGYNEALIYWGWMEIDLYFRLTQKMPWIDLDNYGVDLFHIEHYRDEDRKAQPRKSNPMEVQESYIVNPPDWGFASHDFPICKASSIPQTYPATSGVWRKREIEKRGTDGIEAELRDPKWVMKVFDGFKEAQGFLGGTQEFVSAFQSYEKEFSGGIPQKRAHWDFRSALAWASTTLKPLAYLEVEVGSTEGSLYVTRAFRPVSVTAVGAWRRSEARCINRPEEYSELLGKRLKHQGYVRFVSGSEGLAVQNLTSVLHVEERFDLISIGAITDPVKAAEYCEKILPLLNVGGTVVFGAISEEILEQFIGNLQSSAQKLCLFKGDRALLGFAL